MTDLKAYAVFAETVSTGSMSAAARRLGMTPSAVSQIIRGLEQQAGVTLLHRSTRKLSLTEAGQRCYPHCLRLVEAAGAAASSLERAREVPFGELRIAAPVGFGAHVAPALAPTLAEWPRLRLRLIVDDTLIDLIDARIDIALRVGPLADSSWIGRRLCELGMILCAAPRYLERNGVPGEPVDLNRHHWLALAREMSAMPLPGVDHSGDAAWTLPLDLSDEHGLREQLDVPVHATTTNQIALQQMCEQGMGIACLFYADARPALDQGVLVRVLPGWHLPSRSVTMVMPRRDGEPAKVRVARDAMARYFSTLHTLP
jgi:DNA-binding transcriptional LysR family regulator